MKSIMPIPYYFILENFSLSWKDVLWGYERQLMGWSDAVHLAEERFLSGSEDPLSFPARASRYVDIGHSAEPSVPFRSPVQKPGYNQKMKRVNSP
jgi:hypothetical protein